MAAGDSVAGVGTTSGGNRTIFDFSAGLLSGEELALSTFKGRIVLILNVASL